MASRHGRGVLPPQAIGDADSGPYLPVGTGSVEDPAFEYLVTVATLDGQRRLPLADARVHLGWNDVRVELTAAKFWLGVRVSPPRAQRAPHQVLLDERGRLDLGRRVQLLGGVPGDRFVIVTSTLHKEVRIVHCRDLPFSGLFFEPGVPLP